MLLFSRQTAKWCDDLLFTKLPLLGKRERKRKEKSGMECPGAQIDQLCWKREKGEEKRRVELKKNIYQVLHIRIYK